MAFVDSTAEFDSWFERTIALMADKHFPCTVKGVSYPNDDGTSRQKLIAKCKVGDGIRLRPEPDNPHSSNAIAVDTKLGQIGYLNSYAGEEVCKSMARGEKWGALVRCCGPGEGTHLLGVVIMVFRLTAGFGGK